MNKLKESSYFKIFLVLFFLNLFFIAINLLGAFEGEGKEYAKVLLSTLFDKPLVGLLIGILVTSIIQSSSATTSIVVSFVATGIFGSDIETALYAAIPVIMGANIGTTITNTLVSVAHIGDADEFKRAFTVATVHDIFNLLTVIIVFPIQVYTNFLGKLSLYFSKFVTGGSVSTFHSPLKILIKPQVQFIEELMHIDLISVLVVFFVISFIFFLLVKMYFTNLFEGSKKGKMLFYLLVLYVTIIFSIIFNYSSFVFGSSFSIFILGMFLLFIALISFVNVTKSFTSGKLELLFNNYVFKTPLRAFIVGLILTCIIQSSSVTTSVMIPLAGAGILNIFQVFPYTLGANIGTTITAILAAISLGDVGSISVAFAHMFFNVIGGCIWYPLRIVPITIARKYANLILINKFIPIICIVIIFFIFPILGIFFIK